MLEVAVLVLALWQMVHSLMHLKDAKQRLKEAEERLAESNERMAYWTKQKEHADEMNRRFEALWARLNDGDA